MRNINIRALVFIHSLILFLFLCYLFPYTKGLIRIVDVNAAYFFNNFVRESVFWQNFWAFMNSRRADWLNDVVMSCFLLPYIFIGKKEERLKRAVQVLFLILFTVFCFLVCNRLFFMKLIHPKRPSPSRILPDLFHLSHVITWIKVKIGSSSCFPADHSCTYFMFIVGMFHLRGKKIGLLALLISIPFILPRLITGAHWISDLLMGSLPMALFNLGWLFHTGGFTYIIDKILQTFSRAHDQDAIQKNI